jgi:hypothetical protein
MDRDIGLMHDLEVREIGPGTSMVSGTDRGLVLVPRPCSECKEPREWPLNEKRLWDLVQQQPVDTALRWDLSTGQLC